MSNTNYKVIYTLALHIELQKQGFKYITEMKNPQNHRYNCWVYEATPEFLEVFKRLTEKGGSSNG